MSHKLAARVALVLVGALCAWGAAVPAAQAGTFDVIARWRNCDTYQAAISIRATFRDPVRHYGEGKYMVKKWVKWDALKVGGQWRQRDRHYSERGWVHATNPNWDFVSTAADRTTWGPTLYAERWRAHVTIQLLKNRPGPRDKKVDELDLFFEKRQFTERCYEF